MKTKENVDCYEYSDNFTEIVPDEQSPKKKIPLYSRIWARVLAFLLAVVMIILGIASVAFSCVMIDYDLYTQPKPIIQNDVFSQISNEYVVNVLTYIEFGETEKAYYKCENSNLLKLVIKDTSTDTVVFSYRPSKESYGCYEFTFNQIGTPSSRDVYKAYVTVSANPLVNDVYRIADVIINIAYDMLYMIYVIIALCFILALLCIWFLIYSIFKNNAQKPTQPTFFTKIPLDLFLALVACVIVSFVIVLSYLFDINTEYGIIGLIETSLILLCTILFGLTTLMIFAGCICNFINRVELGKWWQNSIIYRILRFTWRVIKKFLKLKLLRKIPIIYKTVFVLLAVIAVGIFLICAADGEVDLLLFLWLIFACVISALAIYCALAFKQLKKASQNLADGELSYTLDTKYLIADFKDHGDSLNNIAKGMSIAVEDRLKSERMKTELITNVSHDIKTPLTSIINYTDLISKEECNNDKIYEYSEVLLRQSDRLKKLIDDLVEASKASTGNLDVLLAPCEANILLTQTVGEYDEKLKENNLQLIVNQPDEPITILADGRRLWRVFDNLLNNICKYAQKSTRVYLSVEEKQDQAVITFRNISGTPLNVTSDELIERFVRGDSSRNSEGNGLGLSIAKSLTELQNGTFDLIIDGDLFKVVLKFPKISN